MQELKLKVDKIDERLDEMNTNMAVYNEQLKIHIKRSDAMEQEILPIKSKVNQAIGAIKFLGFASVIMAILTAIGLL